MGARFPIALEPVFPRGPGSGCPVSGVVGNVGHEALDGIVRGNVEAVRGPFVVKTFLGLKLIPVLEKALTPARLNAGEFLAS